MRLVKLYRFCFYRLWTATARHDPDGAKHTAVALLSALAVANCMTLLVTIELLAGRTFVRFAPDAGLYGLGLYLAFDVAHYLWLVRGPRLERLRREFEGEARKSYERFYRLYLAGAPAAFFGLILAMIAFDLYGPLRKSG